MVRSKNKRFAKGILDAAWGYFRQRLEVKAVEAGRLTGARNPAGTSRECSGCGKEFENLKLSDRWVHCVCGLSMDRDQNAAINIRGRGRRPRMLTQIEVGSSVVREAAGL